MSAAPGLVAACGLFVAAVLWWRFVAAAADRRSLVAFSLVFPRGLGAGDVESFFAGLSGLLAPWWRRWLHAPAVVLEVHASPDGISHYLFVPVQARPAVEDVLQAALPSVRYTLVPDPPHGPAGPVAASYRMSSRQRVLRIDAPQLAAAQLTSLQPLAGGERVVVQWIVTPAGPMPPARSTSTTGRAWWAAFDDGTRADPEAVAAWRAKQSAPMLRASVRIGVDAATRGRARALLRKVETVWHASRAPGVHLRRSATPPALISTALRARVAPLAGWPLLLNTAELAGLAGLPVEADQVPGLSLGGCRLLAPAPAIASTGLVIGDATFPGSVRPVAIDAQAQLRHLHVVGPTGVGKSTLLLGLITQDIAAGRGVTVLDPKGDLIADVLERVPAHRVSDVVVLDAADESCPVGLNPLRVTTGSGEVAVENLVGTLRATWSQSWGPRLEDTLRAALLSLSLTGAMTLVEVPRLLSDAAFRRRVVGQLDDPVGLEGYWGWYDALSPAEQATVTSPVLNKLRAYTVRPRIRRIIGQAEPRLDMADVLADGKILLVNLAAGILGEDAASLVGSLIVSQLWHATTARAAVDPRHRRLHVAYIDEFQHVINVPTPIGDVLAAARGLGLAVVLAHQHLHQLPTDLRKAVLANARSKVVFQCAAEDAKTLAAEFSSTLTGDDLQGLGPYEVAAQLFADGQVQPPCTLVTRPAPAPTSDPSAIRESSRRGYGRPAADVDAEIAARGSQRTGAPVGSTRRRPRTAEGDSR